MKILIIFLLFPLLIKAQEQETYKVPAGQSVITVTQTRLNDTASSIRAALNGKQPVGAYLVAADIAGKANLVSPSFTTPNIGAATGTSLAVTGNITSSGGGIGYATGNGGTVTQATNKTTGVTINKLSGQITMNGAALAAAAEVAFTVTNSTVSSTDVVIVNVQSVGTAGAYLVSVGSVSNGSFSITVSNASAGSLSQAIVLNFAIIKSVSN